MMHRFPCIIATLVLLACCLASPTRALADEPVSFYYSPWKPYAFEEHGATKGLLVAQVKGIAKQAGIAPTFVNKPWAWVMQAMRHGQADAVFTVYQTTARQEFMVYATEPLGVARNILVGCKKHGKRIRMLQDLAGTVVGTNTGYAYAEDFSEATYFTVDPSPEDRVTLRKCLGERIDYVVVNDNVFRAFAAENPLADALPVQPYIVDQSPIYIAFSKTLGKKAERLALQVSNAIWQMRQQGDLPPLPALGKRPSIQ